MSSIFLEGTVDADSINTGHLTGLPDSWIGTADGTTMSFPGLDASPYDTAVCTIRQARGIHILTNVFNRHPYIHRRRRASTPTPPSHLPSRTLLTLIKPLGACLLIPSLPQHRASSLPLSTAQRLPRPCLKATTSTARQRALPSQQYGQLTCLPRPCPSSLPLPWRMSYLPYR